jgi:hypothetical protein
VKQLDQDRSSAAAYIAAFLPELSKLARNAGHDVLAYFLNLAEAEAKILCDKNAHERASARNENSPPGACSSEGG